jgi:hypothetical protein
MGPFLGIKYAERAQNRPRMYTDFSVTMFVGDFCDHFCALTLYACAENMAQKRPRNTARKIPPQGTSNALP